MYNPHKYNYVSLNKQTINGSRKYATPDGEHLPSVTTILDATKSEESKQALQNWRKRIGVAKAQEITTEAAGRGTRMHKWLENYVKTGSTGEPGSNPYSIQSHQMASSIITQGLIKCNEYWGTEVSLYFPKIYAGTTDLCGVHEGADAILDFKQTHIFPYQIGPYKQNIYIKQPWFENMPDNMFKALKNRLGWHLLITAKLK